MKSLAITSLLFAAAGVAGVNNARQGTGIPVEVVDNPVAANNVLTVVNRADGASGPADRGMQSNNRDASGPADRGMQSNNRDGNGPSERSMQSGNRDGNSPSDTTMQSGNRDGDQVAGRARFDVSNQDPNQPQAHVRLPIRNADPNQPQLHPRLDVRNADPNQVVTRTGLEVARRPEGQQPPAPAAPAPPQQAQPAPQPAHGRLGTVPIVPQRYAGKVDNDSRGYTTWTVPDER